MLGKKFSLIMALLMVSTLLLSACEPETIIQTVVVEQVKVETREVMVEGTPQIVEVTSVVEVVEEVVVTATPEPEPTASPKKTLDGLWYPLGTEPPTLDIQLATDTTSHLIIHQCIEGLFEYRGDGSIEPTGALDYTVSDDGLVYTINLRQDAVWSDGVPVVAQHYVDGVVRLLLPETAAEYAWLMYDVEGAEAFNTGETDDPDHGGHQGPGRLYPGGHPGCRPPTLTPSCPSPPSTPSAWTSSSSMAISGPSRATMSAMAPICWTPGSTRPRWCWSRTRPTGTPTMSASKRSPCPSSTRMPPAGAL